MWLQSARVDEASSRTAISRAYYAAYHAASQFVRAEGLVPPEQHLAHRLVWQLIRNSGRPRSTDIANLGVTLKDVRVVADYWEVFPGDWTSEADRAIANAALVISLLGEM